MNLDDATIAKINDMMTNGGRTINGRWRNTTTGITNACAKGRHHNCNGWIFPIGGVNECSCPCHDDSRPDYGTALAAVVKATDAWAIGQFVEVDDVPAEWLRITFVDTCAKTVHAVDKDGATTVAEFERLNLFHY